MIWKILQEQGKLGLEYYKTPDCKVCKVFSCRNYDRVRTVFVTGGDVQPFIYKLHFHMQNLVLTLWLQKTLVGDTITLSLVKATAFLLWWFLLQPTYFPSQELWSTKNKSGFLQKLCVLFLLRFLLVRFLETCMKMNWYHSLRKLVQFGICASWWILFLVKTEVMLLLPFVAKMQLRKQSNWWVTYFRLDEVM